MIVWAGAKRAVFCGYQRTARADEAVDVKPGAVGYSDKDCFCFTQISGHRISERIRNCVREAR